MSANPGSYHYSILNPARGIGNTNGKGIPSNFRLLDFVRNELFSQAHATKSPRLDSRHSGVASHDIDPHSHNLSGYPG